MRRKSERNKSKSAVDKKTADTTPRKTRRTSRRRKRSTSHSSSEDSDDAPLKPAVVETQETEVSPPSDEPKVSGSRSNSDEDKQEEQPIWKVKTSEAPSGEIQKLKICLQRPPTTPERTEKSPRRRRGKASSQSDDASLTPDEKPQKRKTRRSSPAAQVAEGSSVDNSVIEDAEKDECLIIVTETNEVMIGKGKLDCSQPSQDSENEPCIQDSRTEVQTDESLIESKIEQDMEQDSAPIIKDTVIPQEQQDDKKTDEKKETINETPTIEKMEVTEEKSVKRKSENVTEEKPVKIKSENVTEEKPVKIKSENVTQKINDTDTQSIVVQKTEPEQPMEIEINKEAESNIISDASKNQEIKIEKQEIIEENKINTEKQESNVEQQDSKVEEQDSKIEEQDNKIVEQESIVQEPESKVENQKSSLEEQESKIEDQESKVKDQESKVKDQESKVEDQESKVEDEEKKLEDQENKVEDQENKVEDKEKIVEEDSTTPSNIEKNETVVTEVSTQSNEKQEKMEVTAEIIKETNEPVLCDTKEPQAEILTEVDESIPKTEVQNTETVVKEEAQEKDAVEEKLEVVCSEVKKEVSVNEESELSKKESSSRNVDNDKMKMQTDEEPQLSTTDDSTKELDIPEPEDEPKLEELKHEEEEKSSNDEDKINESTVEDNKSSEVRAVSSEKDQDSKPASPDPDTKNSSNDEKMEVDSPEKLVRRRNWGKYSAPLMEEQPITLNLISSLFPSLKMLNIEDVKLETEEPVREPKVVKKEREVTVQSPLSPKEEDSEKEVSNIGLNRKISIVNDDASKLQPPPSPAKNPVSSVLYITNLVRPFTIKQLQELLSRTGKIVEDGFWTDKIKSKCYVQYETDEEAEATRNALHGVQWPTGNGKKLIIDFGTVESMAAARNAVIEPAAPKPAPEKIIEKVPEYKKEETVTDDDRWEKTRAAAPIREWDLGKVPQDHRDRSRSRDRNQTRLERTDKKRPPRNESPSNGDHLSARKKKKEDTEVKMMDDLFHKTKATPSIYWLPLSPEQIAKKQQQRLQRMAEHKRRMEESRRMERDFGRGAPRNRRRAARYDGD